MKPVATVPKVMSPELMSPEVMKLPHETVPAERRTRTGVLSDADLEQFTEQGYVVVPDCRSGREPARHGGVDLALHGG